MFFLITSPHYARNHFVGGAVAFSKLEIRLLIFARCPASLCFNPNPPPTPRAPPLGPVCCCCSPVHRPPFFPWIGWPVNERQAVQRDSLVLPASSQWLMDATLIRSDPSTSANTTCWRDSVAAVMNFSAIETQPFCKIFFREQSSYHSTKCLLRPARFKLTSTKNQQQVLALA